MTFEEEVTRFLEGGRQQKLKVNYNNNIIYVKCTIRYEQLLQHLDVFTMFTSSPDTIIKRSCPQISFFYYNTFVWNSVKIIVKLKSLRTKDIKVRTCKSISPAHRNIIFKLTYQLLSYSELLYYWPRSGHSFVLTRLWWNPTITPLQWCSCVALFSSTRKPSTENTILPLYQLSWRSVGR
jgi:hypothetical protein